MCGTEGIDSKDSNFPESPNRLSLVTALVTTFMASYFSGSLRLDESFQAKALKLRTGQTFKVEN